MTPLYKVLTTTILELDLWYAEGVQRHLLDDSDKYGDLGAMLEAPLSDYKDAVEAFRKGGPMPKHGKELILKSLEQDREYTRMLCERLQKESVVNPLLLGPASFFARLIMEDIGKGIEEIKQLPERG